MRIYVYILTLFSSCLVLSGSEEVVVNSLGERDYYHLKISLEVDDFRLTHPEEYFDPQWPESTSGVCEFSENSGGFVIYIKKTTIPVSAPYCKSNWLKVTMNGRSNSKEDVQTKRELWNRLVAVKAGEILETPVVLELNPYVTVLNEEPLMLELDYCNLYFRTAWGAYVGNTDTAPNH
jgi:hypothetical protein